MRRYRAPHPSVRLTLVGLISLALGLTPFVHGAYSSGAWAPAGLVIAGLLTGLLVAGGSRTPPRALLAVLALAALGGLTILSAGWSPTADLAHEHGQRLLVLAGLLALLVALVGDRPSAVVALGSALGGIAVVAFWSLAQLLGPSGTDLFLAGRLNGPLGYVNGQGSIYVLGFAACLALVGARSPVAAGGGAGLATLLASLALLSQSRGVLLTLLIATVVVVVCVEGRLRRAGGALVVGVIIATASGALLDVLDASVTSEGATESVRAAGHAVLWSTLVAAVLWGGVVAVVGAVTHERTRSMLRRAASGALVAAALAGTAIGLTHASSIGHTLSAQLRAFLTVEIRADTDGTRLLSGAGTRYDYWRIAVHTFEQHPVTGIGGGGFVVPYFRDRKTDENVRQAHSVFFQTLSDLGVAGIALLALLYGALARAMLGTVRRVGRDPVEQVLVAASCGMTAAWVVHSNIDWILLLPGVTGVAFVALAVLLRPHESTTPVPLPRPALATAWVLAGALILGTSLALAGRLQVRHDLQLAREAQTDDPGRAARLADRAIARDPSALDAYYVKAAALARSGDADATILTLRAAIRRQPSSFVSWALLGDVLSRADRPADADRAYRRALRLNPRDPALQEALASAASTTGDDGAP